MNDFLHGGLSPQHFEVSLVIGRDGTESLHRPMVSATQSVKEVMTVWLINLMNFVEYFVGRSLQVRMMNYGLQFNRQEDPNVPHWDVFYSENLEELIATGVLKPKV